MTFTTQILVVLLIGWNFLSTNQKHYQDLGSERHQYRISPLVPQTSFCEGSSGDLVKRRLFSQAIKVTAISIYPAHFVTFYTSLFSPSIVGYLVRSVYGAIFDSADETGNSVSEH